MSMGYIALALAVASTAVSIDQGKAQSRAQKRSLLAQKQAQQKAENVTIKTSTLAEMEKKKANKKRSNAQQYMAEASLASQRGPASTLMSGGRGGGTLLGGPGTLI